MSQAFAGIGTLLKYSNEDSPLTYTTVAGCSSFKGPGMKAGTYDVTSMDSPDNYREFISGLKEAGDITAAVFFDPTDTSQSDILDFFESRELRAWKLDFNVSPAAGFTFTGVVTAFEFTTPVDGAVTASLTIKITGKATLA